MEEGLDTGFEILWQGWCKHIEDKLREKLEDEIKGLPTSFCADGIIDTCKYDTAPHKCLFVLKDADWLDKTQNRKDLCSYLRKDSFHERDRTWPLVSLWAWGVHNGFPDLAIKKPNENEKRCALQSTAVMNLKKISGAGSVLAEDVVAAAERDAPYIAREFELIRPKIVITCGVDIFQTFCLILGKKTDKRPYDYNAVYEFIEERNVHVVGYRHPARCDHKKSYEQLQLIVQEHSLMDKLMNC